MQNVHATNLQQSAVDTLLKAITGEFTAIHYYKQLANLAPNDMVKKRILEIRADEERHFKKFVHLFACLLGYYPSPQITEQMPTDFKAGVRHAFFDEQNTNDFYRKIAASCPEPSIQRLFFETAAEEQNHAVWFLYFLNEHVK